MQGYRHFASTLRKSVAVTMDVLSAILNFMVREWFTDRRVAPGIGTRGSCWAVCCPVDSKSRPGQ